MKKILRALLVILHVRCCIKNKKRNNLHQHGYTYGKSQSFFFYFSITISFTIFHFEINITFKRLTKSLTFFSTRISYKK